MTWSFSKGRWKQVNPMPESKPTETSGDKTPLWFSTGGESLQLPALKAEAGGDVCVIGGGIAGLTTAYLLTREGNSVILLEDGGIGSGETGRTSAHLANALDDHYYELEKTHGAEGARLAAASHTEAIEEIARIVNEEHIECEFRWVDGYLFRLPGENEDELNQER